MGATTYTQEDSRGRNDNGTIVTATYMPGGNNTDQFMSIDTVFRWRFVIQVGGMDAGDRNFQLWAQINGAAGYLQVEPTDATALGLILADDANSISDNSVTVQDIGDGTYTTGTILVTVMVL